MSIKKVEKTNLQKFSDVALDRSMQNYYQMIQINKTKKERSSDDI